MGIEILSDYSFQIVLIGTALLGMLAGAVGCFSMLKKQSLLGDGVAHSSLPGVVIAFLVFGIKNLEVLLLGALLTGGLSVLCINLIVKNTKIKLDSALAMVLSVFFGAGLVLLTISQKIPNANQAGLDSFIYGQASTMLLRDVKIIAIYAIVCVALLIIFWKEFKIITFDKEHARTIGMKVPVLEGLLSLIIVGVIVIGLQSVGVILVSAMMVAPAIGARQWTKKVEYMVVLASIFGMIASTLGTYISAVNEGIPTGPTIVLCSCIIAIISVAMQKLKNKNH